MKDAPQGINKALMHRLVLQGVSGGVTDRAQTRFVTTGDSQVGTDSHRRGFQRIGGQDTAARASGFVLPEISSKGTPSAPRVVEVPVQTGHDAQPVPMDQAEETSFPTVIEPDVEMMSDEAGPEGKQVHTTGRRRRLGGPAAVITSAALVAGCASTLSGKGAATSEGIVQTAMQQTLSKVIPRIQEFQITQYGHTGAEDLSSGQEVTLSADTATGGQLIVTAILARNASPQGAYVEEVIDEKPDGTSIYLRDPLYSGNLAGPGVYSGEEDNPDGGQIYTYSVQNEQFVAGPADVKEAQTMTGLVLRDVAMAMTGRLKPDIPEVVGY